jgi:ferredoxin
MKVQVDQDTCVGAGGCEAAAPDIFQVKDGKAIVIVDNIPEDQETKVQEAVDSCPTGAISIG